MAKSGLDALLEALKNSGMNTDEFGNASSSGSSANGSAGKGAGTYNSTGGASSSADAKGASGKSSDSSRSKSGRGSRGFGGFGNFGGFGRGDSGDSGSSGGVDMSFFENVHGPKGKGGWIALILIAIVVIGILYWWFHPPISLNSVNLWMYICVICLFFAILFWVKRNTYRKGTDKHEKSPKKAKTYRILFFVPVVIIVIGVVGAIASNAIVPGNAERYSEILKTDTLDFAEDIQEVNYSEIPVIDRDSAILLGNREMGTIPEYVSQFEVSNLYSQINYKGEPVRVSPLNYADLFKWFTNRDTGIPAYSLVNMTTQDS